MYRVLLYFVVFILRGLKRFKRVRTSQQPMVSYRLSFSSNQLNYGINNQFAKRRV